MLKKWIQSTTRLLSNVGMFLLIPMMLLTTGEVVGRAVWSKPIPGSMELSSYMLAVFILLGIAYTHQVRGHVRVTMLVSKLPTSAALVLDIFTTLLSLFIIAVMAWQGWVVGMEERAVSDNLRIPQLPFRLLVFVGGLFLVIELLFDLKESIGRLVKR